MDFEISQRNMVGRQQWIPALVGSFYPCWWVVALPVVCRVVTWVDTFWIETLHTDILVEAAYSFKEVSSTRC